jgi:hypothetical protein
LGAAAGTLVLSASSAFSMSSIGMTGASTTRVRID